MKTRRRDVLKLQASDAMRSLLVERERSGDAWRIAISELSGTPIKEVIVTDQRESRAVFKDFCKQALALVLG